MATSQSADNAHSDDANICIQHRHHHQIESIQKSLIPSTVQFLKRKKKDGARQKQKKKSKKKKKKKTKSRQQR
jgi:hypothetical protein